MSGRSVSKRRADQRGPGRAGTVAGMSMGHGGEEGTYVKGGDVDGLLADVGGAEGGYEVVDGETHGRCGDEAGKQSTN